MALLQSEKTDILRHLEYGIQGLFQMAPAGGSLAYGNMGFRYFKGMGSLLYKLGQLAPAEEATITGKAYGAVGFTGMAPQAGDTITVTISGAGLVTPIAKTITVPPVANYSLLSLAQAIAQAFSLDNTFASAGFIAVADYGAGPFTQSAVQLPLCSFVAPPDATAFVLSVSNSGTTAAQILNQGKKLPPYMQQKQQGQINNIYGYLPILDFLEAGWLGSQQQMSLSKADNVSFRMDEYEQRERLYKTWLRKFAGFMQIPVGPEGDGGGMMQVQV